jgi:hypothetical protein
VVTLCSDMETIAATTSAKADPDILKAKELAAKLRVNERTVRNWRYAGRIPFLLLSPRCLRFRLSEVERALATN